MQAILNNLCIMQRQESDIQYHLPLLQFIAATCQPNKCIVELGMRHGLSTAFLLAGGLKAELVISYELHIDEKMHLFFLANHNNFVIRQHDSRIMHPTDARRVGRWVDILFVDTLHTYEQVRDELNTWKASVNKYIAFHDTYTFKAINQAIDEQLNPDEFTEVYSTPECNGLRLFKRKA